MCRNLEKLKLPPDPLAPEVVQSLSGAWEAVDAYLTTRHPNIPDAPRSVDITLETRLPVVEDPGTPHAPALASLLSRWKRRLLPLERREPLKAAVVRRNARSRGSPPDCFVCGTNVKVGLCLISEDSKQRKFHVLCAWFAAMTEPNSE